MFLALIGWITRLTPYYGAIKIIRLFEKLTFEKLGFIWQGINVKINETKNHLDSVIKTRPTFKYLSIESFQTNINSSNDKFQMCVSTFHWIEFFCRRFISTSNKYWPPFMLKIYVRGFTWQFSSLFYIHDTFLSFYSLWIFCLPHCFSFISAPRFVQSSPPLQGVGLLQYL